MADVTTTEDARRLAEKLIDELLAEADSEQLEHARQMGMVLSLFVGQIEEARERFNREAAEDIEDREEIFEKVVTSKLREG